jgi:hypothetical protein
MVWINSGCNWACAISDRPRPTLTDSSSTCQTQTRERM